MHPRMFSRNGGDVDADQLHGERSPKPSISGRWRDLRRPQFKYPLRWGTRREPEEGEPEITFENSNQLSQDSGIGSSKSPESM